MYTGCPDLYHRYTNTHMFQGVLKPMTSLIECQRSCLEERNCLGVDWKKTSSTDDDSRRCYFVYPESTRYGVQPAADYCCDHYRRTYCLSTALPRPPVTGSNSTTARPQPYRPPSSPLRMFHSSQLKCLLILLIQNHILHALLPDRRRSLEYELRPRSHDSELVPKVNSLTESNFLIRQLYKNCY